MFLSSHLLGEVELICTRAGDDVAAAGWLPRTASIGLLAPTGRRACRHARPRRGGRVLARVTGQVVTRDGDRLRFQLNGIAPERAEPRARRRRRAACASSSIERRTLEDVVPRTCTRTGGGGR